MATPTPTQAAALIISPLVLDSVIESLHLSKGRPIQIVRTLLGNQIKVAVGKDELLRLDVTANSPIDAQTIANAVIDTWLMSTVPAGQVRTDLERRLAYAQASLDSVSRLLKGQNGEGSSALRKPISRGQAGALNADVGDLETRFLAEVLNTQRSLQGVTRDVVKQPPTLPTEPVAPRKSLIAVLSALGSGFALLLWVFMRRAWRSAALEPGGAEKQAKIRSILRRALFGARKA
jgi:hypothetical protein